MSNLIAKTSATIVGDAYRRDLSGVDTEGRFAELLCEITLADAVGGISRTPPVLRPRTRNAKRCDVMVVVEGSELYGEAKRLADPWQGGARSIARSPTGARPRDVDRPRAMDLSSKLKGAHKQFPRVGLNVLFLFHPSAWNAPVYIRQALFGDAAGFDDTTQPNLHEDGLYALPEWQEISACAYSRVNPDGTFSVVQIWRNPRGNAPLPDTIAQGLALAR